MKDEALILGPFQGKPACVHIEVGKGVCGTAVAKNQTQRVADVHAFLAILPVMRTANLKSLFQFIKAAK